MFLDSYQRQLLQTLVVWCCQARVDRLDRRDRVKSDFVIGAFLFVSVLGFSFGILSFFDYRFVYRGFWLILVALFLLVCLFYFSRAMERRRALRLRRIPHFVDLVEKSLPNLTIAEQDLLQQLLVATNSMQSRECVHAILMEISATKYLSKWFFLKFVWAYYGR